MIDLKDKESNPFDNPTAVTATQCVNGALRDLGYDDQTFGTPIHEVMGKVLTFVHRNFVTY